MSSEELTPGHQRADPSSLTADLEANMEGHRVQRAETLSAEAVERAARLAIAQRAAEERAAQQREDAAVKLAEARGALQAEVNMRLTAVENHALAVNGNLGRINDRLTAQDAKLDALLASEGVRSALEKDRTKQLKAANEKQISTRTFLLGCLTVFLMLLGIVIQQALR